MLFVYQQKMPQISDFYNHWRRTLLSSSLVACAVDESNTVETWTDNAGQLGIDVTSNGWTIPKLFRDLPTVWIYFHKLWPHIFAICYFKIYVANSTKIVTISFFFGWPLLVFANDWRSLNFKIHFLAQNKKYMAWFSLDNFDSQTLHSWVGFAYS